MGFPVVEFLLAERADEIDEVARQRRTRARVVRASWRDQIGRQGLLAGLREVDEGGQHRRLVGGDLKEVEAPAGGRSLRAPASLLDRTLLSLMLLQAFSLLSW